VQLDDGTPLRVRIERPSPDALTLDFNGTGGPHPGNMNMPESVTRATILYVMRLLVGRTHGPEGLGLPVAESLLDPVSVTLPPSSILSADVCDDPARAPAVAVGQTDTAQRLVDLLLSALGLAAESQGTMNNLLFGGANWGFYETICGGAGGSMDGPGADAIHTHLTNTRITDVEVLERRHPVRVERLALRPGSGGSGAFPGGNGAVRAIRFLAPASGSFLSQHRTTAPRGLNGGRDGAPGTQRIEHPDGSSTALAGRAAFEARTGDLLVIETPGGGGFGAAT
jgi:5-oxoprolinase (ATP-hydrolysing)